MSYILDALQKSDSERQSQLAPETYRLSRPPEADGHSAQKLLLLICLLVLIAAGLSVLWWLWSPEATSLRPAQRTKMAAPVATAANKPVDTAEPLKAVPQKADAPQPIAPPTAGKTEEQTLANDSSGLEQSAKRTAPNAANPMRKRPEAANSSAPAKARQAELAQPASKPVATQGQSIQRLSRPAPAAPQQKPAHTTLVTTGELPASVRSALPAMAFSFHVYASDPARRTIIINGRRLREGQPINGETRLQRITPDGVIVEFRNYRIELPVINQW